MGFLERKLTQWGLRQAERDLMDFLERLRSMEDSEIGFVVACATNVRHKLEARGYMVLDPMCCATEYPSAVMEIGATIRQLQKEGRLPEAAALMVWAHTLRSGSRAGAQIRHLGSQMWGELERGFPYVERAAAEFELLTGAKLNIAGARHFPIGLTPEPL